MLAHTLPMELCGESALGYLPDPNAVAGEMMVFGEGLQRIDALGGAVLRAAIEYHCRYLQRRMTLSLPREEGCRELFHGLLRDRHPAHLVLPNDSHDQRAPLPPEVLLQAIPLPNHAAAEAAARRIVDRAGPPRAARARLLAKSLLELADNSARHAERCPLPPVACALREGSESQLAVVDLGAPVPAFDEKTLLAALQQSGPTSGVTSIGSQAEQSRTLRELVVFAGEARASWWDGEWIGESHAQVQGFCVGLRIQS